MEAFPGGWLHTFIQSLVCSKKSPETRLALSSRHCASTLKAADDNSEYHSLSNLLVLWSRGLIFERSRSSAGLSESTEYRRCFSHNARLSYIPRDEWLPQISVVCECAKSVIWSFTEVEVGKVVRVSLSELSKFIQGFHNDELKDSAFIREDLRIKEPGWVS